jgi:general secretion pathway protein G
MTRAKWVVWVKVAILIVLCGGMLLWRRTVYITTMQEAREFTLKGNLRTMRGAIDNYRLDKGKYPASLQALVEAGYMREIPVDPVTVKLDWVVVYEKDASGGLTKGGGIDDVGSRSTEMGSNGIRYANW